MIFARIAVFISSGFEDCAFHEKIARRIVQDFMTAALDDLASGHLPRRTYSQVRDHVAFPSVRNSHGGIVSSR
jgi:hypothetical protein